MTDYYVGCYGADMEGTGAGIGRMLQRPDGSLEFDAVLAEVDSPTFLLQAGERLYAAAEGSARVEWFSVPSLEHLGGAPSGGIFPCQLTSVNDAIVVANYFDGTIGVIAADQLEQLIPAAGSGPHPAQAGPHAHASFLVDDHTLLTLDLGADRINVFSVLDDSIEPLDSFAVPAGTAPRDIARHPSGMLFVLGEHGGELLVLEWADRALSLVSSLALPGYLEADQAAAIGLFGNFVYVGLRGSNRVSVLESSADGRSLAEVGWISTQGDWPRHLVVDGDLLHVSNQRSHSVASFRLGTDGIPQLIAEPTPVASPTFLLGIR